MKNVLVNYFFVNFIKVFIQGNYTQLSPENKPLEKRLYFENVIPSRRVFYVCSLIVIHFELFFFVHAVRHLSYNFPIERFYVTLLIQLKFFNFSHSTQIIGPFLVTPSWVYISIIKLWREGRESMKLL